MSAVLIPQYHTQLVLDGCTKLHRCLTSFVIQVQFPLEMTALHKGGLMEQLYADKGQNVGLNSH